MFRDSVEITFVSYVYAMADEKVNIHDGIWLLVTQDL
jgi:hypothetical protein